MSESLITLSNQHTTTHAKQIFKEKRIRHIPIIDNNHQIIGIISDRDIFDTGNSIVLNELMTKNIIVAEKNTPIRRIAEMMVYKRVGAIPIVSEYHAVIGIVTRSDILRALINFGKLELWV